jgi:hypothetical protein
LWWRQINVLFNETRSHAGNFPCYFIANSADDFQTTTLEVDNIGAILAVNIIIMLGGDYQSADQPRAGQEKLKSTITPAKIDSSNVLSVNQTAKKSKNRSKRATRRLEAEFQNLQLDPSSANVSKNSTTKSSVSNVESCAPSPRHPRKSRARARAMMIKTLLLRRINRLHKKKPQTPQ